MKIAEPAGVVGWSVPRTIAASARAVRAGYASDRVAPAAKAPSIRRCSCSAALVEVRVAEADELLVQQRVQLAVVIGRDGVSPASARSGR
jgi:hypothetical protein